jgi:ABC-type phosphate transport system substrate-binding protein
MRRAWAIPAIALAVGHAALLTAGGGDVAVVVNGANRMDSISSKDLKQMFAGEKTRWPDGGKVQLLATNSAMPEHKIAIRFLFGMSEAEYEKYCLHASFAGEAQKAPRDAGPSISVAGMVAALPGALGFVRAGFVIAGVKVLKIDGLKPGDPGYPLSEGK